MKRYIFSLLLSSVTASQAMTWVEQNDNKLTKEAVKALSLLGIKASTDLKEANEILQKYYDASLENIKSGIAIKTEKGKEISHKKLKKFLKYVDKHIKDLTIDKGSLAKDTVAIVPASTIAKVNEHIFDLLKKHINSVSRVVIFAQDEKTKEEVECLFNKKFSHFKNVEYRVASNVKDAVKDCSSQLKKEWDKAKHTPDYAIFTHLKVSNDTIRDCLEGNYKGSEFKALPWRKHKKWFNQPNVYSHALAQLRDFAISVRDHVKKLYK